MSPSGYYVTLVNLAPDARLADSSLGRGQATKYSAAELGHLLTAFCELDAIQNVSADPEIHVHHGAERHIVRTGQKRLLLYNARDNTQPAHVLTTAEILAVFDGSKSRATPPVAAAPAAPSGAVADTGIPVAYESPARRGHVALILIALACAVIAGIVGLRIAQRQPRASDDVVLLPAAERTAAGRTVEGVYVTGSNPGDRGIVIGPTGAIRFFQLKAGAAPTMAHDTWRPGRRDKTLCLAITDLGTVVEIVDRNTVLYRGERYRRAAPP
jgi:hypothetical protein